jgi:hypothetical protein
MGLDMFVKARREPITQSVDFDIKPDDSEVYYWRKHPDLHGWMHRIYKHRGGADPDFNLAPVKITPMDLSMLELVLEEGLLPPTEGFFFGESEPEDNDRTREFIGIAREKIKEGYNLYYYGWW